MFTNKDSRTLINLKILDMIMDDKELLSDRPPTPRKEDCCGNSCNPCIFDIHKKLIDQWNDDKKSNSKIKAKNLLVPTLYKTFEVIKVNEINDDYLTIILHYEDDSHSCLFLNPGQHVIINLLTWSKPFTPITWNDNNIEFLVRVYPNSTFTNKLKNLQVGDEVKVRGPYGEFVYVQNSFKKIIMFCIGSGIAAFYPIIQSIVNNDLEETRIKLFAGFRSVCQIPLKQRLQLLADYWNVEFTIHITEVEEVTTMHNIQIKKERINENIYKAVLQKESSESTLVLICGNEEFNEALSRWTQECNHINYYVFK